MKTNGSSDLGRLARKIRDDHQCSLHQAWKAAQIAMSEYDGDTVMGFLWTEADSLAINAGDRAAWNHARALNQREALGL